MVRGADIPCANEVSSPLLLLFGAQMGCAPTVVFVRMLHSPFQNVIPTSTPSIRSPPCCVALKPSAPGTQVRPNASRTSRQHLSRGLLRILSTPLGCLWRRHTARLRYTLLSFSTHVLRNVGISIFRAPLHQQTLRRRCTTNYAINDGENMRTHSSSLRLFFIFQFISTLELFSKGSLLLPL